MAFDTPANNMAARKRNQHNQNNSNVTQSKKRVGRKFDAKEKTSENAETMLNFTPTTKIVTVILGKIFFLLVQIITTFANAFLKSDEER